MTQKDQPKRKSTRSFNIEKKQKSAFDLEKEPEGATATGADAPIIPTDPSPTPTRKWLVGGVIAVVIIALVAFLCIKQCGIDESNGDETPSIAIASPPDTTKPEATEPTSPTDEPAESASSEEETPDETEDERAATTATGSQAATEGTERAETSAPSTSTPPSTPSTTPSTTTPSPAAATLSESEIEQVAQATIRGEYGNGQQRIDQLGANYAVVQQRVNQTLRQLGLY